MSGHDDSTPPVEPASSPPPADAAAPAAGVPATPPSTPSTAPDGTRTTGGTDDARAPGETGAPPAPRVLVVVVHWNGLELTTRCLESLGRLTYPARQLLVVDNASTDDSGAELARRFPEVEVLRTTENRLYAGGANIGLRRALALGFDYALLLNNDTEVAPDLLERLLEVAAARPKAGLVGPKILYADQPRIIWSAGGRVDFWRGLAHHIGLRQEDGPAYDVERDVDYLTGCCLLVTRRAIVDIGYLDPGYHMYSEDADWCMRARELGIGVRFAPRAHVWHHVSAASGGGLTPYKMYHRVRSNLMFLRRHARPHHWLTIPFWLPIEFARFALGRGRHGQRGVIGAGLRALLDLVRHRPRRTP